MKIKFLKEYVAFYDFEEAFEASNTYEVGEIKNVTSKSAQWLIDNGFAKEVIESGRWKPKFDEMYYCLNGNGIIMFETWCNDELDESRYSVGNCFKTKESAERHRDYLKAVETVRHDEGFMKEDKTYGKVWVLRRAYLDSGGFFTARNVAVGFCNPGAFYFDTEKHAIASSERHPNQWQTILNYDWSKGGDDED